MLTDKQIRAVKPGDKPLREAGLVLFPPRVGKTGKILPSKWRMKYRHPVTRRENVLTFGSYPQVSLAEARQKRDAAKKLLADGIDPSANKKDEIAASKKVHANTFKTIGDEWLELHKNETVEKTYETTESRLLAYIYPEIGHLPISEIRASLILDLIRKMERKGILESARRTLSYIRRIFQYAIITDRADNNPATGLVEALKKRAVVHHPAITDKNRLRALLVAMDVYEGSPQVKGALWLSAWTFQRPGEIRHARWEHFDRNEWVWTHQFSKQRKYREKKTITVPLPTQAVEVFEHLHTITGRCEFVFPGARSPRKPMSENGINSALAYMGFKGEHTAHGYRATAKTLLGVELDEDDRHIEKQLAHNVKEATGAAYNRREYLDQRRAMLQRWADFLDELKGVP